MNETERNASLVTIEFLLFIVMSHFLNFLINAYHFYNNHNIHLSLLNIKRLSKTIEIASTTVKLVINENSNENIWQLVVALTCGRMFTADQGP